MGEVELIGKQIGQYRINWLIGQGGMATVYRANQAGVDRQVAIKVMSSELSHDQHFIERFKREAKTIAKLEHPHILPAIEFGEHDGFLYLVMRLVDGGSLDDKVHNSFLTVARISEILTQVASALDYAHRRGVVHRDLKPNNVLLDRDGNAYLADFGLASIPNAGASLTSTGVVLGTPSYMAPEQWRSETVDSRTDVYALGAMLYEMVTGVAPFRADTVFGLMHKHMETPPPSISNKRADIPELVIERIDEIIAKAMAKKPGDRYPSAGELATDFAKLSGSPSQTNRSAPSAAFQAPPRTINLQMDSAPAPVVIPAPAPKKDPALSVAASPAPAKTNRSSVLAAIVVLALLFAVGALATILIPKNANAGIPTVMQIAQGGDDQTDNQSVVTKAPASTLTPTLTPQQSATPYSTATRLPTSTSIPTTAAPTLAKPTAAPVSKLGYRQGTLDFIDRFNKTLNWNGAQAKLVPGGYLQTTDNPSGNTTAAHTSIAKLASGKSYDDFFASAKFKITPTDKPAGAGIVYHLDDAGNYYFAGLFKSGNKGEFLVQTYNNGVLNQALHSAVTQISDVNVIEILSVGNTDTFWLNGAEIGQIKAPKSEMGTFGLTASAFGSSGSATVIYWDNFQVYK